MKTGQKIVANLINELRECLNGDKKLDRFNLEEIECILHIICID